MTFELPPVVPEDPQDDTQSTDLDLESLVRKYITPIERFRSYAAPIIVAPVQVAANERQANEINQQEVSATSLNKREPQESRCHAFYRMIGLPVVANDAAYYNPGFNPRGGGDEKRKHSQIASNVSQSVLLMHTMRENSARARLAYFKVGGADSSVFSVVLGLPQPNDSKRFMLMDTTKSWSEHDVQMFTNNARKVYIERNYEKSSGEDITNFFVQNSHILKPFTVDASIDRTATPGERAWICQPFMKEKNDTRFDEPDVALLRPGIEFVLRLRLLQRSNREAMEELVTLFDAQSTNAPQAAQSNASQITFSELAAIAGAILEENKITEDNAKEQIQEILGRSAVELLTLNKYVKLIKGLVNRLYDETEMIKSVTKAINWTPLAEEGGPEDGTDISNLIKTKKKRSEIDQRIARLIIKQQSAKRQAAISRDENNPAYPLEYKDFALSEFQNTGKLFDQELNSEQEKKNNWIKEGSDALQAIELITGEVSGLGLVDIIALYTALWAIEVDVLVALLDEQAFERLYDNNKELRVGAVLDRHNGSPKYNVVEALEKFEDQVVNILAFADRLFEFLLNIKDHSRGGVFPRSE
jgi:hypothetical protein